MAVKRGISPPVKTPDSPRSPFHKIRHVQKRALLLGYAECGTINGAVAAAGCDRTSHYVWLNTDPDYAEAFKVAHEMAIWAHEDEASRRALGWNETQYKPDGTAYTVRKFSDTMLIFRLKALVPERYREAARRDERSDVSELLKAVLLELVDRQHARDGATPVVDWSPVPPEVREPPRLGLPAPPDVEEDT
jgi:hypothetical protein